MDTFTYDGAEPIRLNKWLAQSGVCSRREADALIGEGRVRVDGETVTDAGRKLTRGQTVSFGDAQATAAKLTVIYNKPVGIVSGQPEPGETPAVRMIRRANVFGPADTYPDRDSRLAPIGRLDKDSHGLLILSEDGVLAGLAVGECPVPAHYLRGGNAAWQAAGLPLSTEPRMADEPLDYWPKPYERSGDTKAAMNEYLSWEVDLLPRIERDGTMRLTPSP